MILDEKKIPIIHSTLFYRKWGDLENSRIVGLSSTKRNYNEICQISNEAIIILRERKISKFPLMNESALMNAVL